MNLEALSALHEISQLKYRYIRGLDTHDWALVGDCFIEEATVWYSDGAFSCEGRDNIVALLDQLMSTSTWSSHIVLQPEIELIGPDTARGIWRLQDVVYFKGPNAAFGELNIQGGEVMTGAGYYYDDYVRRDGVWKVARMGYMRLFELIERRSEPQRYDLDTPPERGVAKNW